MITDNDYYKQITTLKRQAVIVRSEIERVTNEFFYMHNFTFVDPPVLHESIANKKSEIYLPLYNEKYSLTSSNALYMGMYTSEFQKVFTISKCFRDETDTQNHLIEFSMLEVEMVDCTFNEMIDFIKDYVLFVLSKLLTSDKLISYHELRERIKKLKDTFNPRIMSYNDFIDELYNLGYDVFDKDISNIDYLVSMHLKETIIIVDYPSKYATWTAKKKDNNISIALNILLPESYGELCEGCERTNDTKLLQHKIEIANVKQLQWYVDAVEKIKAARCGFGIGIDRLVRWIIGANKISDCRIFPRINDGGE